MSKIIVFDSVCREKLKAGVDTLANAVKVTLGPKGRNVAIEKYDDYPHVTKDGVTVAREIELEDKFENIGAQMVKEVAARTADIAGDGTTTATVLAQCIYTEGLKNVVAGFSPINIKKELELGCEKVIKYLELISKPIDTNEEIKYIASVSANNTTIGELIAEGVEKIGKNGILTISESKTTETYLDTVPGMQFQKGYISQYFINNTEEQTCELLNPYILIYEGILENMQELLPIVEQVLEENRSLLIICDGLQGEALNTLVINKVKKILQVCAVIAPGYGEKRIEMSEDISILVGATYVNNTSGLLLHNLKLIDLGSAEKVIVTKTSTTIINGYGSFNAIDNRIEALKIQSKMVSSYDLSRIQQRIANLAGGIAIIYVGANSEIEMKEKKDRLEDALHATRAAIEEGIVPGGGIALLRAISVLGNTTGELILAKALMEPIKQILINAGLETPVIIQNIIDNKDIDFGFNAMIETYENFYTSGVIDPTKVTRIALEHAVSVSSMLLTTECIIVNKSNL